MPALFMKTISILCLFVANLAVAQNLTLVAVDSPTGYEMKLLNLPIVERSTYEQEGMWMIANLMHGRIVPFAQHQNTNFLLSYYTLKLIGKKLRNFNAKAQKLRELGTNFDTEFGLLRADLSDAILSLRTEIFKKFAEYFLLSDEDKKVQLEEARDQVAIHFSEHWATVVGSYKKETITYTGTIEDYAIDSLDLIDLKDVITIDRNRIAIDEKKPAFLEPRITTGALAELIKSSFHLYRKQGEEAFPVIDIRELELLHGAVNVDKLFTEIKLHKSSKGMPASSAKEKLQIDLELKYLRQIKKNLLNTLNTLRVYSALRPKIRSYYQPKGSRHNPDLEYYNYWSHDSGKIIPMQPEKTKVELLEALFSKEEQTYSTRYERTLKEADILIAEDLILPAIEKSRDVLVQIEAIQSLLKGVSKAIILRTH